MIGGTTGEGSVDEKITMIKLWLKENKKWAFSGIGTFIVAIIVSLIWTPSTDSQKRPDNQIDTTTNPLRLSGEDQRITISSHFADTLTPYGILRAIDEAAPFHRNEVKRGFYGTTVSWEGILVTMERAFERDRFIKDSNLVNIRIDIEGSRRTALVVFTVNLNDYPGLQILPAGHKIRVSGDIEGILLRLISLANARVAY